MSKESCGNCKFFLLDYDEFTYGDCCIRRPTVMGDDGSCTFPAVHQETWCGEWRSKTAVVGQNLYRLPNGQWITTSGVSAVVAHPNPAPRVAVCFHDGAPHEIKCDTLESAEAMRDKIAEDVNRMVGEAKK